MPGAKKLHEAHRLIRGEHRNVVALLSCFKGLLRDAEARGKAPEFELLEDILRYLEEYLNRFHHPKESAHLFPALRRRDEKSADILAVLDDQHEKVGPMLARLRERLAACRSGGTAHLSALSEAAERYVRLELQHMAREEEEVLTAAERSLSEDDWAQINAAFRANDDPLFGAERRREYAKLFSEIVARAPAPHGLGDPA